MIEKNQNPESQQTATGNSKVFTVPFYILSAEDLLVYEGVEETLLELGKDYKVRNVRKNSGCEVEFFPKAPTEGTLLRFVRRTLIHQPVDFKYNDELPSETLEESVDRPILITQELDRRLGNIEELDIPGLAERAQAAAENAEASEQAARDAAELSVSAKEDAVIAAQEAGDAKESAEAAAEDARNSMEAAAISAASAAESAIEAKEAARDSSSYKTSWKEKVMGLVSEFPADAAAGDRYLVQSGVGGTWLPTNLADQNIVSAVIHEGETLLIGGEKIYSLDPKTLRVTPKVNVPGASFYHAASDGSTLVIGSDRGIYHWRSGEAAPTLTNKTEGWFRTAPAVYKGKAFFGNSYWRKTHPPEEAEHYSKDCPVWYDFATGRVTTMQQEAVTVTGDRRLWPWKDNTGYPTGGEAWLIKDDVLWCGTRTGICRIDGSTSGGKLVCHVPVCNFKRYWEHGEEGLMIRGLCEFQGKVLGAGAWARVIVDEENDEQYEQSNYPDSHPDYRVCANKTFDGKLLLADFGGGKGEIVMFDDMDDVMQGQELRTISGEQCKSLTVSDTGVYAGIASSNAGRNGIFYYDGSSLRKVSGSAMAAQNYTGEIPGVGIFSTGSGFYVQPSWASSQAAIVEKKEGGGLEYIPLGDGDDVRVVNGVHYVMENGVLVEDTGGSGVRKSTLIPLMDGEASIGMDNGYAPGDHRHPTDTSRLSVAEFEQFKEQITSDQGHEYVKISPLMTSNTSPAPFAATSSSVESPGLEPWHAFDGIEGEGGMWAAHVSDFYNTYYSDTCFIALDFGVPQKVDKVRYLNRSRFSHTIRDFILQGSDNGESWVDIQSYTNCPNIGSWQEVIVDTPRTFRHVRLKITRIWGQIVVLYELEFYTSGQVRLYGINANKGRVTNVANAVQVLDAVNKGQMDTLEGEIESKADTFVDYEGARKLLPEQLPSEAKGGEAYIFSDPSVWNLFASRLGDESNTEEYGYVSYCECGGGMDTEDPSMHCGLISLPLNSPVGWKMIVANGNTSQVGDTSLSVVWTNERRLSERISLQNGTAAMFIKISASAWKKVPPLM